MILLPYSVSLLIYLPLIVWVLDVKSGSVVFEVAILLWIFLFYNFFKFFCIFFVFLFSVVLFVCLTAFGV